MILIIVITNGIMFVLSKGHDCFNPVLLMLFIIPYKYFYAFMCGLTDCVREPVQLHYNQESLEVIFFLYPFLKS